MNTVTKNLSEQLGPLVGLNGWDYCVHWKLSKDRRSLFWTGCSCSGTESTKNGGDKLVFRVSSVAPCRDTMFRHPRTESCALLSQVPVFITLDSGIHAETLSSNESKWLNHTNSLDSNTSEKTVGTQVLILVAGGLVELFATKQVIDFVTCRCKLAVERTKSKNLEAEYKRRERLTKKLFSLRSLVPIVSERERASIIGDTIEYVKDLQKQVRELQEELLQLEKNSEVDEHEAPDNIVGVEMGPVKADQVEVADIEGNELYVKVLCDHRRGGFVKLMEAFHSLGLHVISANVVTSHHGLVSNVFKLQKEEMNEIVRAEEVRKLLVQVMRKPCRGRSSGAASQNGGPSFFMLSFCLLLLFLFLSSLYNYFMSICPKYVESSVLNVIFENN